MARGSRSDVNLAVSFVALLALLAAGCASGGTAGAQDGDAAAAAPSAAPMPASSPGREADEGGGDAPAAPVDGARIVRTGSLGLQVKDVLAAVSAAQQAIDGLGGYVGASHQATQDDRPVAQITYRIPSARWDDALEALKGLGTALDEQTEALEVTGQLVDLAARIENLRASERALQAIAASATRVADVLEVQRRLFEVRGEIEQLSAQQAHLEDQASYGTLTVTYGVEIVAIAEAAKGWDAGAEVDRATASLVDVLQALATAGIWFGIVWLPILLVLVALAVVVILVLRRLGIVRRPSPAVPPSASPIA